MPYLRIILMLSFLCCATANADVWSWVDAKGNTYFVDTNTPIYTWLGEGGKRHYSDTPDHEEAIAVQLIWRAKGTLENFEDSAVSNEDRYSYPGETSIQRAQRFDAEAYYCKRATEIYDSYANAPRLYRTNDAGEREYLSEDEAKTTLVETQVKMEDLCK